LSGGVAGVIGATGRVAQSWTREKDCGYGRRGERVKLGEFHWVWDESGAFFMD